MLQILFDHPFSGPYLDDQPFPLRIGENCALLPLDARPKSPLNWSSELAERALEVGQKLLWLFDFGFEHSLKKEQFLTSQLAIDHFVRTLYAKFKDATIGVVLYAGLPVEISERDRFLDYLQMLAVALPEELSPLLFFEMHALTIVQQLHWCSTSFLDPFILGWEGMPLELPGIRWMTGAPFFPSGDSALLLPPQHAPIALFERTAAHIEQLRQRECSFRLVHEEQLIEQWSGLERLYYDPNLLSSTGTRALQGFVAAAGQLFPIA